ncbi:hypothetical protein F5Y14DRAFT_465318 [Nemania sp. NC0429]|nr:hypothetical protein F5Y14DRAFT_465318 [Nemania sp. NC0429]
MGTVWYAIKGKLAKNSAFVSESFTSTTPPPQALRQNPQHALPTMTGNPEPRKSGRIRTKRKLSDSEIGPAANASIDHLIDPRLRDPPTISQVPEGDAGAAAAAAGNAGDQDSVVPAKKAKRPRARTATQRKRAPAKKSALKKDDNATNKKKGKSVRFADNANEYDEYDDNDNDGYNEAGDPTINNTIVNSCDAHGGGVMLHQGSHNLLQQNNDPGSQEFNADVQRAWDNGLLRDGFGPGQTFGGGPVLPLPPRSYGFGMGTYESYEDDENPNFTPYESHEDDENPEYHAI